MVVLLREPWSSSSRRPAYAAIANAVAIGSGSTDRSASISSRLYAYVSDGAGGVARRILATVVVELLGKLEDRAEGGLDVFQRVAAESTLRQFV